MTEEEFKTAKNVLSMLFNDATAAVGGLTEIAKKINDDAIDIRQLLESTSEGTSSEKDEGSDISNYSNL